MGECKAPRLRRIMTALPMLRDEYCRLRVEVRPSTLTAHMAGEGLFALSDFVAGDILAFYNGVKGAVVPRQSKLKNNNGYPLNEGR